MKQYLKRDGPPKLSEGEYNIFQGYVHGELTDEQYEKWMLEPELKLLYDRIDYHFKHVLAAGNEEFDIY